ncbi:MAG: hypothetical protein V4692_13850, partial [Bdellovibrionota bacterium]
TPVIEKLIQKMQTIRSTRLQLMKAGLSDRGYEAAGFKIVRVLPKALIKGVGYELHMILENGAEVFMGDLFAQVYGYDLEIISYTAAVQERFRGLGVNTVLAAFSIEDNPQTEMIDSSLTDVNLSVFQRALQMGLKPHDALAKTPAVKLRSILGFVVDYSRSTIPTRSGDPRLEIIAVREDLL